MSIFNIRIWLIQGFLLLAWIILRYAMNTGLAVPGLHMTGIRCFSETVLIVFFFVWISCFYAFLRKFVSSHLWRWGGEILAMAAFVAAIVWVDWEPLSHGLNSSGDHLMHFTLATLTEWNLRFQWSLMGWSNAFGMGFPLNELYPPGGNLIFCFFRLLTFGSVPREWIYTVVVFASYLAFAFLLYAIVRKWFGRAAAVLLLLLLLLDGGDGMNFGWPQFFYIGMWGSGLGLGLSLFAFSLCADIESPFTKWRVFLLAVIFSFSILLHPLFLYTNILWIVLLLLMRVIFKKYRLFTENKDDREVYTFNGRSSTFLLKSFAIVIGVGLTAFWWIPFFMSREWIYPYGFWGRTMPDIGRELMKGVLFQNATAFHTTLGFIGIMWGLFSRRLFAVVLALFSLVNLFLGLDAARTFFQLETAQTFFEHIQLERLIGLGKISAMLLAAGFLGIQLERWYGNFHFEFSFLQNHQHQKQTQEKESSFLFRQSLSDICVISIVVILATPVLSLGKTVAGSAWRWYVEPMAQKVGAPPETPSYWPYFTDVLDVLEARESERNPSLFFENPLLSFRTLTYDSWRIISAPAFASVGIAGPVYMPAIIIGTRPFFFQERDLNLANVKYVFDWKVAPYHEIKKLDGLTAIYENQEMILYERSAWTGRGWDLHGSGTVTPLPAIGKNLRFQVEGAKADSHLRLGISRYRKWNAYIDGTPVRTFRLEQPFETPEDRKLIGIQLRNGILEVRYENAWYDYAAYLLSWGVFLFVGILIVRKSVWDRLQNLSLSLSANSMWTHGSAALLDTAVVVFVLTILLTSFFLPKPNYSNQLRYLGVLADRVGEMERYPDGRKDLCFELDFAAKAKTAAVERIELFLLGEEGEHIPRAAWQTQSGSWPKIGIGDMLGVRLDHEDGSIDIPVRYFQKLHLFVSRLPHLELPETIRAECILTFEDGTKVPIRMK